MIWLTWRQLRGSAAVVLGALALAVLALAVTGPQLADILRVSGTDFFDRLGTDGTKKAVFYLGTAAAYAVPAVVGAFWGAPLVAREVEAGTHRLVWNQSITRTRWLATKLGLAGLGAVVAGSIGLVVTWWCHPLDEAVGRGYTDNGPFSVPRLWPELFGSRGIVPIGMTVLALAVGVTVGLLVRRTVAAMAVTLAVVVAVQIATPVLVQSHLLAPERLTTTITATNLRGIQMAGEPGAADPRIGRVEVAVDQPGAWVTQNRTVDPDGKVVEFLPAWAEDCAPAPGTSPDTAVACFTRLAEEGYRQQVEYLPASRFWALQWMETGVLLGLALGLVGFCFWRIRRDLT
ncbi:MAG: hypothetical protein JWO11_3466 [Nocardioides sp.]|nr:hypothetical protein [Nocardioides sp.]